MNEQIYGGIDVPNVISLWGFQVENRPKPLPTTPKVSNKRGIPEKICKSGLNRPRSTGGLEIPLAKALYREGFRVVISNPRQTNQFAMSQSRAKTDAKDAKMLASYTQMLVLCGELEKQLWN